MKTWVRSRIQSMSQPGRAILTQLAKLDARDWTILLGLGLLWYGLRNVYAPLAPIAVGCFLLWFTTIRRVPE